MYDIDTLISRQPCPWRINVPPPRDRLFEVMTRGTRLICGYDEINECWLTSSQPEDRLEREDINHWRELSRDQWDQILNLLARKQEGDEYALDEILAYRALSDADANTQH